MNKILLFILLFVTGISAQDESIKKLFPAKWKMDFDKADIYEEWSIVNDTELIGKSYSLENNEQKISETLYLKKFDDTWAYVAIPKNQIITLFRLIESSSNRFVFENKEHDFPQRIIYEFHEDGKLRASIEGEVNGELKRKEFSFTLLD